MRLCSRCGVNPRKPGQGQRLCATCKPRSDRIEGVPSPCRQCGTRENKDANRTRCRECLELAEWRTKTRKHAKAVTARKPCRDCGGRKESTPSPYCQACRENRKKASGACVRCHQNPKRAKGAQLCVECAEAGKALQHRNAAARARAYRANDREHYREISRQSYYRRQADTKMHERDLETKRLRYRIANPDIKPIWKPGKTPRIALPGAPLVAAIDRAAETAGYVTVCELIGLNERQVYRWRVGEAGASLDHADRVLTALGLLWFDVYGDDPVAAAAFTGEPVAA